MSDDRLVVRIDRDLDGVTDERIEPELPRGAHTEPPRHVDLPPQPNRLTPVGGWDGPTPGNELIGAGRGRQSAATWRFALAAMVVIIVAGVGAVAASRLVEWSNPSDGLETFVGMLVGVACAVGAFLAIAWLTRMLRLDSTDNRSDDED